MYHAHFGLNKGLFASGIAQESAVYLGAKQQLAVANCKIALTTFDSAVVLIGPAGVGKTTLAATALRESTTRLALGWLNGGPTNASELLEMLLAEFGLSATRTGRVERLQMWRQFLNETNATDSRVFVIVECAEDMAPELLRALESLTRADANGCRGANLVLLGQPGLTEHLQAPSLESLRQRIRLRQKLEPLTIDELRDYLAQHVTQAGGAFDAVFAADAVAAVQQHSGGIPRVVNNLCETALTLAATRRERQLTAELVKRIAVGMFGLEAAPPSVDTPTPNAIAPTPNVPPLPQSVAAPAAPSFAPPAASTAPPAPSVSPSRAAPPAATAAPPAASVQPAPPRAAAPSPAPAAKTQPAPSGAAPTRAATPRPLLMPDNAALQPRAIEYDGSETDIANEILGETTLADVPEVAMAEFPVLTDAVEAPQRPPPRTEPPRPAQTRAEPARAKPAAAPSTPKPSPAAPAADGDEARQTQTARPRAAATSIDDITNTMAEPLFGEADLDMLSTALASAGWPENEGETAAGPAGANAANAAGSTAPAKAVDPFDLFDLGPDAPLELIDDSSLPPQKPFKKLASDR